MSNLHIAIVGLAGRFPGAPDAEAFWRNLSAGVESIAAFTDQELQAAGVSTHVIADPNYVKRRGKLDSIDLFDAELFGFTAREAAITDPQHRLFLECVWEAFEAAGYGADRYRPITGIFAGASLSEYWLEVMRSGEDAFRTVLGNQQDFLSTRVAYKLDLRGPAVTVQTACSTSLVAVHLACQSLLAGECEMAVAGGASVGTPQVRGYVYDGGIGSPDGHCRAFDRQARGTVDGSGVGVVVLKRLSDAMEQGDVIRAVIRGSAVNNDGGRKVGYTAPSVEGQVRVIAEALAVSGVEAGTVEYIEAHGTGTELGDPIEVEALNRCYRARTERRGYCGLASVKSNIGHLDAAAGVAGLIKASLAVERGWIPATVNWTEANPKMDLADSPFYVNAELRKWESATARRAGVSSFGIGGTNAHVVLEQGPEPGASGAGRGSELVVVSGRSASARDAVCERLLERLEAEPGVKLADVGYTLAVGRQGMEERAAVVGRSVEEVSEALRERKWITGRVGESRPAVAFLFPGQGAQYAGMGRELYEREAVFREQVDACAEIVGEDGVQLLRWLYPSEADGGEAGRRLEETELTQVALFTVEYALARQWMHWGVEPTAVLGHSVGEYVAGCVAGVFGLSDALGVVAERGRRMQAAAAGAMTAVWESEAGLRERLDEPRYRGQLNIAAVNGAELVVASGPEAAVVELERELEREAVSYKRLPGKRAFHSWMMGDAAAGVERRLGGVRLQGPTVPMVSNVSGQWVSAAEVTAARYWGRQAQEPVRWADMVRTVQQQQPGCVLLEVGPGHTLTRLAQAAGGVTSCPSLPSSAQGDALDTMLGTLGRLWTIGVDPDWKAFYQGQKRRRLPLPTYPFQRKSFWIASTAAIPTPESDVVGDSSMEKKMLTGLDASEAYAGHFSEILRHLTSIAAELTGSDVNEIDPSRTFLEAGVDSLLLIQFNRAVYKRFGIKVELRQLFDEMGTLNALTDHVAQQTYIPPVSEPLPLSQKTELTIAPSAHSLLPPQPLAPSVTPPGLFKIIESQLEVMAQQLRMLGQAPAPIASEQIKALAPVESPSVENRIRTHYTPYRPPQRQGESISPVQRTHLERFVREYSGKTKASKALAQAGRAKLADSRTVHGYRHLWKEQVYPIVPERGEGAHITDVDGNRYVDITMGFGALLLGHNPEPVRRSVLAAIDAGFGIGPQPRDTADVASLICDLTDMERAMFCVTGTEAVMAALRIARTATQRSKFVMFSGAYHGWSDATLARQFGGTRAIPLAPGVAESALEDTVVLNDDDPGALEIIERLGSNCAAILVEPVQSRRPDFQSRDFLKSLRTIADRIGCALIFDEMITGFRVHPGGCQAWSGVKADIATYGKIVGGGMPIGVVAGSRKYLDVVDGGMWQFGDDTSPTVDRTLIAGTFSKHPWTLAASKAILSHLKALGPGLQERLNRLTDELASSVNQFCHDRGIPASIVHFGSLFRVSFQGSQPYSSLFYYELLNRGVFVLDGGNFFLSTAHTQVDVDFVRDAIQNALLSLLQNGWLTSDSIAEQLAVSAPAEKSAPVRTGPIELPLTGQQKELWMLSQLGEDASRSYNEALVIRVHGSLNRSLFCRSIQKLVDRHDALRTHFRPDGTAQIVEPALAIDIPYLDFSSQKKHEAEAALQEEIDREAREVFEFTGQMVRTVLIRMDAETHVCVITLHHILSDGWSFGVLIRELVAIYEAGAEGREPTLSDAPQFERLIVPENVMIEEQDGDAESFWSQFLEGASWQLSYPSPQDREPESSFRGFQLRSTLDATVTESVVKLAVRHGCTLTVALLALFQETVHRITGQNDIIVSMPSAGQVAADQEDLVGFCVNMLPLRSRFDGSATIGQWMKAARTVVLDAQTHQGDNVASLLRTIHGKSHYRPSAVFNFDSAVGGFRCAELDLTLETAHNGGSKFELYLNGVRKGDQIELIWEFNRGAFDSTTAERAISVFHTLVHQAISSPEYRLSELETVEVEERREMLEGWNDTVRGFDRAGLIQEGIEEQARVQPRAVAVEYEGEQLSYGELNERANRAAAVLRNLGVGAGSYVGIVMDRSAEMVVGALAVLKSGGAYVPMEPGYPGERRRKIAASVGMKCVLSQSWQAVRLEEMEGVERVIWLDAGAVGGERWIEYGSAELGGESGANVKAEGSSEDLAYVIFTSGSTGEPKGVMVQHRPVVNLIEWVNREFGVNRQDRLLFVTSLCFDLSVYDMFGMLAAGGVVEVASQREVSEPDLLVEKLYGGEVSFWDSAPAALQQLTGLMDGRRAGQSRLRLVFLSGDWIPVSLPGQIREGFGPEVEVTGLGGATEATVWSNYFRIGEVKREWTSIPYGRPIQNSRYYVLDRNLNCCAVGVTGDLYIGGECLSVGYVNQAQQTAERFIPDRYSGEAGGRLYRTGDQARYWGDGTLEFLGRADEQVKIRGYRVELGEVEAALRQHAGIGEAVVVADGERTGKRLVAYLVAGNGERAGVEQLRAHVRERLPEYMVPAAYQWLETLPVTANGKLDRRALPSPDYGQSRTQQPRQLHSALEQLLAAVWADVLKVPQIGPDDNFFALGGHSLLAMEILLRLRSMFEVEIPLRFLMESPLLSEFANRVAQLIEPEDIEKISNVQSGSMAEAETAFAGF